MFAKNGGLVNNETAAESIRFVCSAPAYCITPYFRGRTISRKVNLRYFREKIFSLLFTRKFLPAKISSRENIFPRKYLFVRAANM